jgi:hypothetical protein
MSWGIFPAEIYLLIAEALQTNCNKDETIRSGLAVLNLAASSRSHYTLISRWASPIAQPDLIKLRKVLDDSQRYAPSQTLGSPLSVLCRRISRVCAFCADRSDHTEIFSGLQICKACDAFLTPKVSYCRVHGLFELNKSGIRDKLNDTVRNQCRWFFPTGDEDGDVDNQGPLVHWGDILELMKLDCIKKIPDPQGTRRFFLGGRNGEDFGVYNEASRAYMDWTHTLPWYQACLRWDPDLQGEERDNMSPSMSEMVLFREFRYRFDPCWSPKENKEAELIEYFRIAKAWFPYWYERPWRPNNFPVQPESEFAKGHLDSDYSVSNCWRDLKSYRTHCAKLREIFKRCPQAFLCPEMWTSWIKNKVGQWSIGPQHGGASERKDRNPEGRNFRCLLIRARGLGSYTEVKLCQLDSEAESQALDRARRDKDLVEVMTFDADGRATVRQVERGWYFNSKSQLRSYYLSCPRTFGLNLPRSGTARLVVGAGAPLGRLVGAMWGRTLINSLLSSLFPSPEPTVEIKLLE